MIRTSYHSHVFACLAAASILTTGCGSDSTNGTTSGAVAGGSITFTASGEKLALTGYSFPPAPDSGEFVDGWEVRFNQFIVTIDKIKISEDPDMNPGNQSETGPQVAEVDGPFVVDLHKGGPLPGKGGGGEQAVEIATLDNQNLAGGAAFDADTRYAFGFDLVAATDAAKDVNLDAAGKTAYEEMKKNGWVVLYDGTATFKGTACSPADKSFDDFPKTVHFHLGFASPTSYVNCQNPDNDPAKPLGDEEHERGFAIKANATTFAQVTVHSDHPFWESFVHDSPAHFDMLAAQHVGETSPTVELDDVKGVDPTAITDKNGKPVLWRTCDAANYTPPGKGQMSFDTLGVPVDPTGNPATSIRDLYDYMTYNQSTQGHLNSDGLCYVDRHYPSPAVSDRLEMRRALCAVVVLLVLALATRASANGRYPQAGQIAVDPDDARRMLVRATYGFLATSDGGAHWRWICESAVGFSGAEDPEIALPRGGKALVAMYEGLSVGADDRCSFARAPVVGARPTIDLTVAASDPTRVLAVAWPSFDVVSTDLFTSTNGGASWTQTAQLEGFAALTIDTARSDAKRLYATGGSNASNGEIATSRDGGRSWEINPVRGASVTTRPYVGAVDPTDADVVWVRLHGDTDSLALSRDAGATFSTVFSMHGSLYAFALSPDGKEVLVGGPTVGLYHASTTDLQFEPISGVGAQCLTWTPDAVFVCGDEATDHFSVGRSTDGGRTFLPLLVEAQIEGPVACAAHSPVGAACDAAWPAIACVLRSTPCTPPEDAGTSVLPPTPTVAAGGGCSIGATVAPPGALVLAALGLTLRWLRGIRAR